ncbi:DMT family transporter [Nostoc sp. FACHB-152]|uniref:DMT family transporter n=1 Tax=unclassified Nostoc TaxID=2593658 RepID=UPI001687C085|nr:MULTISPECIES: DMT family transporter [unclassified Nostoc]MBD2446916.1 DMT family transporter [Nostoc sp. FACHB-152]MBD2467747.1 DMT family transporter [Nostoc sp. FACHB-145]
MKVDDCNQSTQNGLHIWGIIAIAIVSLIWATTFPLTKDAVTSFSPAVLTASRFTVAAAIFTPSLRSLNAEILRDGIVLGLLLFVCFTCQAVGLETANANQGGFIFSLNVIIVPLLGAFFGQSLLLKTVLAAAIALTGIGIMCWENGSLGMGDLLLFGDTCFYGVYMLVLQGTVQRHSTLTLTAIQLWSIAVLSAIWAAPEIVGQFETLSNNYSVILYLGLVGTAACIWLETIGQQWISASEAALLCTLDPVLTSVFSFWLLGEKFGVRGLIGTALVLTALILSQSKSQYIDRKLIFGTDDV